MSEKSHPYRLGALPNINIPDNFDDIKIDDFDEYLDNDFEISESHKQILSERLEQYQKDNNKGNSYEIVLTDIRSRLKKAMSK